MSGQSFTLPPWLLDLAREALAHPDPKIRQYAIFIMNLALWPEFLDLLRSVEAHDVDENVRYEAARLCEAIEAGRIITPSTKPPTSRTVQLVPPMSFISGSFKSSIHNGFTKK